MTTRARMWTGILVSACLFTAWMLAGLFLARGGTAWGGPAGSLVAILVLQVITTASVFYTASKVTLHRYEVVFEERLKAQVLEMSRRIEEMKRIVDQIEVTFRDRSQALAEDLSTVVREALSRDPSAH